MKQILMIGRLPTQEHLWFITVLFVCYLIVPVFSLFKKAVYELMSLIALFGLLALVYRCTGHIYCYWIANYFLGYCMGRFGKSQLYIFITGALLFIVSVTSIETPNIALGFSNSEILHITFAIIIFYVGMVLLEKLFNRHEIKKLPRPIGQFEFEMYLVHPIFIYGPFALIFVSPYAPFNIIVMTIALSIATLFFIKFRKSVSRFVTNIK